MNARIDDSAQRLRALDPLESFIVQAPAGSGKTELLIQRFLRLLATVEQPESVVAVTFTRKAAGEMRHRIIDALVNAASATAPQEEHRQQTWELCRRVLARDAELGWQLIQHPTRLRIQTIDSLCAMLVRQMPWLSRMGASAPPEERADYLYLQAARATIEQLESGGAFAAAVECLLKHLDNDLSGVERLLAGMLKRRDSWLRHVVPNQPSAELRHALQSAMRQIIENELERVRSSFPSDLAASTIQFAHIAALNVVIEKPESDIRHCEGLAELPTARFEAFYQWRGLAELFLTAGGDRRKKLDKNTGFPAGVAFQAIKKDCLALELPVELLKALHGIRALPPAAFGDSQWDVLSALMALLPFAAAQLKVVFQREGKVDFTEIAHASRDALGTSDNPTDLAFSMDCRIQHLLIDEFQDTSHGQYELLKALTAEWTPGDGRTLFLVGDPMQSIYGFREAEVALFLKARQHGLGNIRLTPLQLSVNFRSSAAIVNWVNDALGPAFPSHADSFTGAVTYAPSTSFHSGDVLSAVHIHPSFEKDHSAEAEKVVSIIEQARQQNREARIAVLVRARSHLAAIVDELRRRDIRFQAVEIDSLGARPIALDLLAVTLALLNPADRLSWLSILRAPWCGLTLADLKALVGDDRDTTIWDLLNDESRLHAVSEDGRGRIERVRSVLSATLEQRGRLPLRRWVEATWIALGGPAALKNKTELNDASVFLDLLESSAAGADLRDPERFLRNVESLFARPDAEANENLQLLTIHKAKGLEFDTVIIPGLGRNPRGDDRRLLRWLEYMDSNAQPQLLLAPIKETGTKTDAAYAYVQRIESLKAENESIRLLYVAATRAKSHLHLLGHTEFDFESGTVKRPGSRTLLGKFWDAAAAKFDSAAAVIQAPQALAAVAAPAPLPAGPPLRRFPSGWRPAAAPSDVRWSSEFAGAASAVSIEDATRNQPVTFEWASDLPRRVGIVVHAMLQQAADSGSLELQRPRIAAALVAQGLYGERLREGISRVEQALRATAMDERGRWILALHSEDQREYALCGLIGGRVRHFTLDRTFVDEGVRWIIDYKTGSHEGGNLELFLDSEWERYRPQLESYARLMSRLDSRPIRMGLYFPMLQAWREWA